KIAPVNVLLICSLIITSDYSYLFIHFFFFKQKTAYEMVGSDWSSDVYSSDLRRRAAPAARGSRECRSSRSPARSSARSEERRVGKECYQPCRSRWSPDH